MLYQRKSRKSLEEIDQGLQEAAARHKFGVIAVHDLQATMKKKGVDFDRRCLIYEVCNPSQAKRVLEADPSVSTALPCRISVYETEEGLEVATMLPTEMMKAFGKPELEPVAREVEDVIVAMIDEAA